MPEIGKLLVSVGLLLVVIGGLVWLGSGYFQWFGNLPGDIKIVREDFRFYFPITTMILISLVLSLLLWIIRQLT